MGIDNKLRVQTGSDVKYFLTDHLGSTNGLADSSGNLTASTSYDSFGNATNQNFPTRYQFTGREFDNFTGLHYYRARFYDANLGRFISEDPIGLAGGINKYGYVKNSPLNFTDSLGLVQDGPTNFLRDPVAHDSYLNLGGLTNGLSNTVSDLLGLDIIAQSAYTVGDYCRPNSERAMAGIIGLGVAALDIAGGSSVGSAINGGIKAVFNAVGRRAFATGFGEAVFWRGMQAEATTFAINNSGKTIGMTAGGKVLNFMDKFLPYKGVMQPLWKGGSSYFAEEATGVVNAFIRNPVPLDSIWRTELRILTERSIPIVYH